jgi:WD40 repeat protein
MSHAGEVGDALFSPDGWWVATADCGQIRLWEAATGKPMTPWLPLTKSGETPVYFANHLSFARDGKSLLAGLRTKHQSLFDFDELFRPIRPTLGAAELVELSELNAGGFLDAKGGVDSMPGEEWLKRWRSFRRKHPEAHPME